MNADGLHRDFIKEVNGAKIYGVTLISEGEIMAAAADLIVVAYVIVSHDGMECIFHAKDHQTFRQLVDKISKILAGFKTADEISEWLTKVKEGGSFLPF